MRNRLLEILPGWVVIFLLCSIGAVAQVPYSVYLTNDVATTNTYSFDVWVRTNNSADVMNLANLQLGIAVNAAIRPSGSTTTVAFTNSQFVSTQVPTSVVYNATTNYVNIAARANPGCGTGTNITNAGSPCVNPGIRFGTITITNSVAWTASSQANLTLNFTAASGRTEIGRAHV